jgi:predicted alpha/beta superfamily hydrolase
MPGTELLQMTSTHTGRDYDLYISNPGGRKDGTLYPVVYVLDGQWFFKTVDSIWAAMLYDRFLPAAIIVGITYSGQAPGYCELRMLDMTPTPVAWAPDGSGEAAKFLAAIEHEILLLVESRYPVDPARRTLTGCSLGGLFTLYALFERPDLFASYIASSPAIDFEGEALFELEARLAENRTALPVRLHMFIGGLEYPPWLQASPDGVDAEEAQSRGV